MPGGMPTRGIVHNGSGATPLPANYHISVTNSYIGTKSDSRKVTVEKRGEDAVWYSQLPAGRRGLGKTGAARRQVVPRVPCAEGREDTLLL